MSAQTIEPELVKCGDCEHHQLAPAQFRSGVLFYSCMVKQRDAVERSTYNSPNYPRSCDSFVSRVVGEPTQVVTEAVFSTESTAANNPFDNKYKAPSVPVAPPEFHSAPWKPNTHDIFTKPGTHDEFNLGDPAHAPTEAPSVSKQVQPDPFDLNGL